MLTEEKDILILRGCASKLIHHVIVVMSFNMFPSTNTHSSDSK